MALRLASSTLLKKVAPRISATTTAAAFSTAAASDLDRLQSVDHYEAVLDKFAEIRACAVLRTATSEACPKAMQAAIDGGFEICEFTLTTPDCLHHLADFRQKYDGGKIMVGCGTILTIADAEAAIDAGAEFIITPVMLPDVIEWCAARNIVCVPGCQTPTEASTLVIQSLTGNMHIAHLLTHSSFSFLQYYSLSQPIVPVHRCKNYSLVWPGAQVGSRQ